MASRPESATFAYRIVSSRCPPFDGAGCHRWGSRWLSPGRFGVHAAETWSLAVLENLVHWQVGAPPPDLVVVRITVPDDVDQEQVDRADTQSADRGYAAFRDIGDDWYDRGDSAVLWVPSVVSPVEWNVVFNARHPDVARLDIGRPVPARIDPRLLAGGRP